MAKKLNVVDDAKPCPSCGSDGVLATVDIIDRWNSKALAFVAVKCFSCERRGEKGVDMDEAVRLWNLSAGGSEFVVPKVDIYPWLEPGTRKEKFRCDIDVGPGCHGIGGTPARALNQATLAWMLKEKKMELDAKAQA